MISLTTPDLYRHALTGKRVAVTGAVADPRHFAYRLAQTLQGRGCEVAWVAPCPGAENEQNAVPSIAQLDPPPAEALLLTAPASPQPAIQACAAAGLARVWLPRMRLGYGLRRIARQLRSGDRSLLAALEQVWVTGGTGQLTDRELDEAVRWNPLTLDNIGTKLLDPSYLEPLKRHPQVGAPVLIGLRRLLQNRPLPEALNLTLAWYFEDGGEEQAFGPESEITRFLMADKGVREARRAFVRRGGVNMLGDSAYRYVFDTEFFPETARMLFADQWSGSFLGGYVVEMRNLDQAPGAERQVEITVTNNTGWASACRIPFTSRSTRADEARAVPGPGGTMVQRFRWRETIRSIPC